LINFLTLITGICVVMIIAGANDFACCIVRLKVYIGHTESISNVIFMPDSKSLVSFGEAIFVWDFLASESGNFVPPAAE